MYKVFRMGKHAFQRLRERFPADMSCHDILCKLNTNLSEGYVTKGTQKEPRGVYFPTSGMVVWTVVSDENPEEMFVTTVCSAYCIQRKTKRVKILWKSLERGEDEQIKNNTEVRAAQETEALGFC